MDARRAARCRALLPSAKNLPTPSRRMTLHKMLDKEKPPPSSPPSSFREKLYLVAQPPQQILRLDWFWFCRRPEEEFRTRGGAVE